MDDLKLEPYAVTLTFTFPEIRDRWEELLSQFLIMIAREATQNGKSIVGHIKTLALFPENGFFRMSVIAPNIPPTTEGQIPPGCTEMEITLNVLVYGISEKDLAEITRLQIEKTCQDWAGKIFLA